MFTLNPNSHTFSTNMCFKIGSGWKSKPGFMFNLLLIFRKTTTDRKNFKPFVILYGLMWASLPNFNTNSFAIFRIQSNSRGAIASLNRTGIRFERVT